MPILLVLIGLLTPRVLILILWFFTVWFRGVFDTLLWPMVGFFFLPTTLLWYSAVQNWFGGEWGTLQIIGIVVALVIDTSSPAGARRRGA